MQITKPQGFVKVGRTRDSVGNALTELLLSGKLEVGQSLIIGHREYAKLHGENEGEVIVSGKYQRNSPKYREVRMVNQHNGWDAHKRGGTKGYTTNSVVINEEKTGKEVGLNVGDFAFQITKLS